jgi:AcrR family transcriptional regulator
MYTQIVAILFGMARPYRMKRRQESRELTHRRIIEAAVALHTTVGPAQTTVTAIAEGAGVERLTFYRHFPSEQDLLWACSRHYLQSNLPPDPDAWRRISQPSRRLRTALRDLFQYYERTERRWVLIRRDAQLRPDLRQYGAAYVEIWKGMKAALLEGRDLGGSRRAVAGAAIGHALDFSTWQSLVRQQGLEERTAIRLLAAMVEAAGRRARQPG